jgi:hypothetical protein
MSDTRHPSILGFSGLTETLKNGKELSEPVQPPTNLAEQSQISEKFARSVSQVFSPERTSAIADHVIRLESTGRSRDSRTY